MQSSPGEPWQGRTSLAGKIGSGFQKTDSGLRPDSTRTLTSAALVVIVSEWRRYRTRQWSRQFSGCFVVVTIPDRSENGFGHRDDPSRFADRTR